MWKGESLPQGMEELGRNVAQYSFDLQVKQQVGEVAPARGVGDVVGGVGGDTPIGPTLFALSS